MQGIEGVAILGEDLLIDNNWQLPTCVAVDYMDQLIMDGWSGLACIETNLDDACDDVLDGC